MTRQGVSSKRQSGSSLITVTILLGTMTVLTLVFLRVGQHAGQEQSASLGSARADLLVEAGISEAIEALRSGQSGNLASAGDPAYLGGGVLWVEATDLGDGLIQLDSMAMKGGGRAALRVVVEDESFGAEGEGAEPDNGFFHMLFANKHLQLDQGIVIDSYDSSLGSYASQAVNNHDGTTYANASGGAGGNSTIQLDATVKVFGDVACGPELSPTLADSSYVSGSTASNSQTIPLAPITVPAVESSGACSVANFQTKTIDSGTYHFTSCTQGKSSLLKVTGPATIVLDGYTAGAGATLEVDCTNGPVTFYVTGTWSVDKNYTVKPKDGTPVNAAFLIESATTVEFDQGSKIQVGFYAPSGIIEVKQGAEVWGGLVADQIEVNQNTKFHFDENLRNFDLPWEVPDAAAEDDGVVDPKIRSWSRIEFPLRAYAADRRDPLEILGVEKDDLRSPAQAWEEPEEELQGGDIKEEQVGEEAVEEEGLLEKLVEELKGQ